MTSKAKGGRGRKAENPYERFTVSLPPALKLWLDELATQQGVTRSEALALLLTEAQETATKGRPKAPSVLPGTPELFAVLETPGAGPQPAPKAVPEKPQSDKASGATLTTAQRQLCGALRMPEAVAE